MTRIGTLSGLLAGAILVAVPATGRQAQASTAPSAADTTRSAPASPEEPKLIYEREVFTYPADNRRDPFTPLVGDKVRDMGTRFEDLSLRGIIYSPARDRSMALLADPTGRIYRVRRGEVVGNSRVIDIEPFRVTFEVETFGLTRRDALELRRPRPGGDAR